MCERDMTTLVGVKIQADLSCTGKEHWTAAKIDSCIANLVHALQSGGIDMRGSCCGHGEGFGEINLQDGRTLLILGPEDASDYTTANTDEERLGILASVLYRRFRLLSQQALDRAQ